MKTDRQRMLEDFMIRFDRCETDKDRWLEVVRITCANQLHDKDNWWITVMLDNDDTFVVVNDQDSDPDSYDNWTGNFDWYIGNSRGVRVFLEMIGIPCEDV